MSATALSPSAAGSSLARRQESRIERAVRSERKDGARLSFRLRLIVMLLVGCYLLTYGIELRQIANLAGLAALCLIGWTQYRLAGTAWDRPAIIGALPVLDVLILVWLYFLEAEWQSSAPRVLLDEDRGITWFLLLLTLQALSYRPWLAAWTGLVTAAAWLSVYFWMLSYPGAYGSILDLRPGADSVAAFMRAYYDPLYINTEAWLREALVTLICGGILAIAVRRSRSMILRALQAERSRANLARYFSPSMVDVLSVRDRPFDRPRETEIGVLFADIVGFTRIAESSSPAGVIALLREFHGRVARAVFDNDGTLDKFIGDSAMATFGTPQTAPNDAARTIACCRAIAESIEDWNSERHRSGLQPIGIGIGAHFGRVVLGDIGDERRLEFAVLGDTVNVANRLEALTRTLGATILISDDLVNAARREGAAADELTKDFSSIEPQQLRNREERVGVWAYFAARSPSPEAQGEGRGGVFASLERDARPR